MNTKSKKVRPPKVPPEERDQVRARRKLEHGFALMMDEHGRERLVAGTAEAARRYDVSSGGIVRLRLADPLKDISALTAHQRQAGVRYRVAYEAIAQSGMKSSSFAEHVDGGALHKDIPATILDAWGRLRTIRSGLHASVVAVLDHICGLRMSVRETSEATGFRRDAVTMLLTIGLDGIAGPEIAARNRGNERYYDKSA